MPLPFVPAATDAWYRSKYLDEGLGCREIAKVLCVSRDKVRKDLRRAGIALRPQTRWSTLKRNYFSAIDTPTKAYILGLICADGTLDPATQQLRLRLAVGDRELLEEIRTELRGPPVTVMAPARSGRQATASLCISSKQIVDDLMRLGVSKRKDYVLGPVANVSKSLMPHFVRGLVDGDGCLKFTGTGRTPRLEFTNRNRHLLEAVRTCWERVGARVKESPWREYPRIYCDARGSIAVARSLYLTDTTAMALARKRDLARAFDARAVRARQ